MKEREADATRPEEQCLYEVLRSSYSEEYVSRVGTLTSCAKAWWTVR
jgi:hypothetical protein